MGKTIQVGGTGKNPAIEKINNLNALNSRLKAAARLEEEAFFSQRAEEAGKSGTESYRNTPLILERQEERHERLSSEDRTTDISCGHKADGKPGD